MKFLIVDDSVFSQQFTKKVILSKYPGAELFFAASGEEGLSLYKAENHDFIITDLLMDGIGGQAMIGMILDYNKDARIIVLTSDIQKAVKQEILDMGVYRFINKPLRNENEQALLCALEGACI